MAKVLEGIRVLEWGMLQQGPVASALLADLGAEVIKIESLRGDNSRYITYFYGQESGLPGNSTTYFESCNRNKKGITLDMKVPEGRELLYKLVEKSDVFLTNFKPGTPEKLGAGYEDLKKINPKIIYAYATGLGLHGPDKDAALIDFIAMGRSGIMHSVGDVNDDRPGFIQGAFCDQMGAICTAFGVLAALMARERHGMGQLVEVNLLSAFSNLNWINVNQFGWTHKAISRNNAKRPSNPLSNYYQCKDGKWIMLGAYLPKFIKDFFTIVNMPEIANNEKYTTQKGVAMDSEMLTGLVAEAMKTKDRAEWMQIFKEKGFMMGPINTYDELFEDPQMLENHGFYDLEYPGWDGPVKLVGAPFYLNETPCTIEKWAPKLGEDNASVYGELCGVSAEELAILKEKGAI